MFMDNHSTWTWTEQEIADWTAARGVIQDTWAAASNRLDVTTWGEEKTALVRLSKRVAAEYRLLERTDHDTVNRVVRDYPRLVEAIKRGDILEVVPEILGDSDAD